MTFMGMIGSIQAMAYGVAKQWGNRFAVDELVNEAWIKSLRNCHTDPPLIMRAAKLDMIDYIRTHVGRKYNTRNGKKVGGIFKPKYHTNLMDGGRDGWAHPNTYFDGEYYDKNFKNLENDELIESLLSATTTKRATAMIYFYIKGNSLVETGLLLGKSDTNICNLLTKGRADCKEKLVCMKLEYAEI